MIGIWVPALLGAGLLGGWLGHWLLLEWQRHTGAQDSR